MDRRSRFDPSQHLALEDVATDDKWQPTMIQITLKHSKTDPFQKGVDIVVGTTGNDLCPVKAGSARLPRDEGRSPWSSVDVEGRYVLDSIALRDQGQGGTGSPQLHVNHTVLWA